jgi:tetratricopeptide (TPR) repeat protein
LWLIKVWFSASTFVVEIATFAKPKTVIGYFRTTKTIKMEKLKLDEQLDKEIEDLWFEGGRLVYDFNNRDKSDLMKAADLMEKTWEMLPSPKEGYSPSFHITENLTKAFIGLQQFEEAEKWLDIYKTTGLGRIDSGEKDFLEGEFYFAQGELEKAKPCFAIANKKSGGRLFIRQDRKHYKELLSKEDVRPTSLTELLKTAKKEIKNKNYGKALDLLYDALNLNQLKVEVHFNKGLCHFELGEFDHAADSFTRAYMLDGETIFKKHDTKYFEFLKTKIKLNP